MNKKFLKKENLLLVLLVALFLVVRSVNFSYHLNFTNDQALFSTKALEIYRTHHPVLIGPPISVNFNGREVFQGPIIYYELLFFLILGGFDPIASSFAFTIFCGLMIFPLYYGVKYLLNKESAFVMVLIYTLSPYYINYTRFLWNPNFQFSLLPILFLFMGQYKKKETKRRFFLISFTLGLLLQFHYQFILIIASLFIYYFAVKRIKLSNLVPFFLGTGLGFSPLILFELRNHFYNINTLILFWKNYADLARPGGESTPHYFLSISLFLLLGLLSFINWFYPEGKRILRIKYKRNTQKKLLYVFFGVLTAVLLYKAVSVNFPKPSESFWSYSRNWNYLGERKVYEIVRKENLQSYNIADLTYYDTLATTVKYLLMRDNVKIDYVDYYHNNYLYVIYKTDDFSSIQSYEVATFKPYKIEKKWKINDTYNLYLLKRLPKS